MPARPLAADIKALATTAVFGLMSDGTALFVATLGAMGVRFYGSRKPLIVAGLGAGLGTTLKSKDLFRGQPPTAACSARSRMAAAVA